MRYEQVNAMLLNEFLKEHRKVERQRKDFESRKPLSRSSKSKLKRLLRAYRK